MNEEQVREIIRDEIARAANIWFYECATMEHAITDKWGTCYGMYPATLKEKIDRFVECVVG